MFVKKLFGFEPKEFIAKKLCVPSPMGCGKPALEFDDESSKKEYHISGLCQECQKLLFAK